MMLQVSGFIYDGPLRGVNQVCGVAGSPQLQPVGGLLERQPGFGTESPGQTNLPGVALDAVIQVSFLPVELLRLLSPNWF